MTLDPRDAPVPRYGEASLDEVVPSVLSAVGVDGFANALGVEPLRDACVLVLDGFGWELLLRYPDGSPFLAGVANDRGRAVTAGFPSTTSTSLASLGTGLPPGEHGLVGYTFALPGFDRPLNSLQWELYGHGEPGNMRERARPEEVQPEPTVIERSAASGRQVVVVGPTMHGGSPLTRAILRGGTFRGADTAEDVADRVAEALASPEGGPVYAYYPFVDMMAHIHGVPSDEWRAQLHVVDAMSASIAERLPAGTALFVTADHGMVDVAPEDKLDVEDHPELMAGVRMLAGEARARHVHVRDGALSDVLAIWRDVVGDRMWIGERDEAISLGWFGPKVHDRVRPRIGDVVAAAAQPMGVFNRRVDPLQYSLVAHHGSMTSPEQLVPFLEIRP